jgi:acyl-CoA synthetase (NDP forming)
MLEQLAEIAAERDITRFDAEVLGDNRAMLHVFSAAGFGVRRQTEYGEVHLSLDIRPTDVSEETIAERTHRAAVASLRPLLQPASVAVVGGLGVGAALFRSMVVGGFAGPATPVNRNGAVMSSVRSVASLADLPEAPELVVVAVPPDDVLPTVEEAADAGARAVLVVTTGFSDADSEEGRVREEALLEAVRGRGVRMLGPNSVGLLNTDPAVRLDVFLGDVSARRGGVALSSQSGALGLALLGHLRARRLGVAAFVSLGNRADVSTNDLLEYWADEERCRVIALYVESFGNPRRFAQVARRVSRLKPVLVVKGRRAPLPENAQSRTAAALGAEGAIGALFRQAGVLRVESTDALFDAADLLERQPLPRGRRVGVVTNSGGMGRLAMDACQMLDLVVAELSEATLATLAERLPRADRVRNPVDLGVGAPASDYLVATAALLADERVDALLVLHAGAGVDPSHGLAQLERATEDSEKPVIACVVGADGWMPLRESWRVPNFRFPEAAVRALALAADRRDWLSRPIGMRPGLDDVDADAARAIADRALAGPGPGWVDVAEVEALLETHGLPLLRVRACADADAAVAAAAAAHCPVALKAVLPQPALAGDIDAVLLGLEGESAVRSGWTELERRVRSAGRDWAGAFVQPLAPPGADVLVGAVVEPDLGPVIAVGMGGRNAGLSADAALRLSPLRDLDADELIDDAAAVRAWIDGLRGNPPLSRSALRDLILRFGLLVDHVAELAEADLNPVRVHAEGAVVLDARIRLAPRPEPRHPKTW